MTCHLILCPDRNNTTCNRGDNWPHWMPLHMNTALQSNAFKNQCERMYHWAKIKKSQHRRTITITITCTITTTNFHFFWINCSRSKSDWIPKVFQWYHIISYHLHLL